MHRCATYLTCLLGLSLGQLGESSADAGTLGLMVNAGAPDGLGGSVVWRPTPRIRTHGGIGYNGIAPGAQAGVTLAAIPYWITPTATVEVGRFFRGNANSLMNMVGANTEDEPVLREVGYDFATAHVGLEFGYSAMTFYLHGGMSVVQGKVRNVDESINSALEEDGPRVEVRSDPVVRVTAPSAQLGFIYYF